MLKQGKTRLFAEIAVNFPQVPGVHSGSSRRFRGPSGKVDSDRKTFDGKYQKRRKRRTSGDCSIVCSPIWISPKSKISKTAILLYIYYTLLYICYTLLFSFLVYLFFLLIFDIIHFQNNLNHLYFHIIYSLLTTSQLYNWGWSFSNKILFCHNLKSTNTFSINI